MQRPVKKARTSVMDKPQITLKLDVGEALSHGCFSLPLNSGDEKVWAYLAKAKDVQPHVAQDVKAEGYDTAALFEGQPDEFLKFHKEDPVLKRQMKNKVRKCPNCGKPVAFTLSNCNGCGRDLSDVDIGFTNNIFMGFVYGIQKGPFPYTISVRSQTPEVLVFDDLLALTPCHLNVVPGDKYLPDWRFLLKDPPAGSAILDELFESCWKVLYTQFWANEDFRNKVFKDGTQDISEEELKKHLACGFNYPPSQYQLHLQFMLPPFLPFQYYMYVKGNHFTPGRFFPIEYARKVLALNEPYDVKDDTPIEDIVAFYKEKGVDYEEIHSACYERYGASHRTLANWKADEFEAVVVGSSVFSLTDGTTLEEVPKDLVGSDKLVLQNYGRPYKGRPSGTYYKYAKKFPDGVKVL